PLLHQRGAVLGLRSLAQLIAQVLELLGDRGLGRCHGCGRRLQTGVHVMEKRHLLVDHLVRHHPDRTGLDAVGTALSHHGAVARESAMPAVLVHGVPDTHRLWDALRARLARRDVTAVSLPGFGAAVPAGFDATKEAYVD